MLLLVAHPLPPFGFGSRRNRQSVLLHDWIPWSILYPDLFAGSSWCTTHTHIFPLPLVQYPLHLIWRQLGRLPPRHFGDVWDHSAKLRPKSLYMPLGHTYGLPPLTDSCLSWSAPLRNVWPWQSNVLSSFSLIDTGQNNPLRSAWF